MQISKSVQVAMMKMRCMKLWQVRCAEKQKSSSEKNAEQIRCFSKTIKDWRESKNEVMNEMEDMEKLKMKLLNDKSAPPCEIMCIWLKQELQKVAMEIEVDNVMIGRDISPIIKKDVEMKNDWHKME